MKTGFPRNPHSSLIIPFTAACGVERVTAHGRRLPPRFMRWGSAENTQMIRTLRCTCMKKILACFLVSIVTGFWVSASFAGTYISGNLGLVTVNDSDTDDGLDTGEFTFDKGAGIVWALGSSFQNGGRVEAELGYRSNSFDELKVDGVGKFDIDGDITSNSLMGNAYYDISTEGSFTPYIGAGIGFALVEADFDYFDSEDDTVFAYQLILGGSFSSSEQFSVDLQYRYFATDDPEFNGLDAEYSTHNVMIGFRRSF